MVNFIFGLLCAFLGKMQYFQHSRFQSVLSDIGFARVMVEQCRNVAVKKSGQKKYHVGGRDFSK